MNDGQLFIISTSANRVVGELNLTVSTDTATPLI
jgi:hypothetical protein